MLEAQDLTYRIGGRTLLDQASLQVFKGQHIGLIGRNGIGKSTLFKLILGEESPDGGKLTLERNLKIGTVAQEVPMGDATPLEFVLEADLERASLLKELETLEDPYRIVEIHERLNEIDGYTAETRAAKILKGLGFSETMQNDPLSSYSGGWRMRVALAAVLFTTPDLLLLDEPTNHLDFESVTWLENYLKSYPATFIVVSHDRAFLNTVATHICHLHQGKLTLYSGNFDFYERTRRERMRLAHKAHEKQEAAKAHMQKFIDRFRAKASKAKQAQSRMKMLEKFEPIAVETDDPSLTLHFPEPVELPSPLIMLENVTVGYGEEKPILWRLNQRIGTDSRIALLGANGNGKSTFAKLLAGVLPPQKGEIQVFPKVSVGYFHQHQLEILNLEETPFDHLADLLKEKRPEQIRTRLGQFGFSKEKADLKVKHLSGGEKSRLALALITAHAPSILILDEPTNHLDMETRESLIMAINEFKGAVILITHDMHFLKLTSDTLWVVENQSVHPFSGDLEEYKESVSSMKK